MRIQQFDQFPNFNYYKDFQHLGGNLNYYKIDNIRKLQALRDLLPQHKRSPNYLKILSVNEKRKNQKGYHPLGMATDVFCPLRKVSVNTFVEHALSVGFRGIGVYVNAEGILSFHLDIREGPIQLWSATKEKRSDPWTYGSLIDYDFN